MNFAKWIHVRIQGWKGLATVRLPVETTVSDFKVMMGLETYSAVTVPASFLPLASEIDLYNSVNEFDTVRIER